MKEVVCNNCSNKVLIDNSFASRCDECGTEYNSLGQELEPREDRGWETGERF